MFDFVRTHQKLMQIILAILIVPSFALVGISGYKSFGDDANTLAKVDGQPLTQQELDNAQRNQLENFRQRLGPQFDQKQFETPEFKQNVLDTLIAERAVNSEVRRAHLTVSDATLQKLILEIPGLVNDQGKFDVERYKAILAAQGMSPEMHQARLRQDLSLQQLTGAIELSGFAPRTVSKMISDFGAQEREVQEALLPIAQFVPQVKVTDEMVKAFYDKNAKLFAVPEQAKIEYVVLNAAAVESQVSATDEEVASFYKQNEKKFGEEEARRSSHILIKFGADKAASKAKAEAILAEVRKNPSSFAAVAKAKSEDPGSAEQGGDLDFLVKGTFVKPVEDAILSLKQGEISNLVESEFGYHIITVTSLKPAHIKSLDEVKGEIAADIKKQKAGKKYSELAETFTNTVYEQADSLKPVADKLQLKIETAAGLTRTPSPALGQAPFNNAKFLTALFSDDAIKNKRNTEAVEVAPSTLIAGRIVEFKPATKRPLAEVDADIRKQVTMEEALKLAHKAGEEKLAAARKSGDAAGFGEAKLVSRAKPEFNPAAFRAVMSADVSKLPAYVGVDVPGVGYGVYRIGKVQQPEKVDTARREAEASQIGSMVAQGEMVGYVEVLKQKAKVKIIRPMNAEQPKAE